MSLAILSIDTPVLVDAAIKSFVLLAVTALVVAAMRRASAAARHLVWFLGMLAVLVLPLASAIIPGKPMILSWPATAAAPAAPASQIPRQVAVAQEAGPIAAPPAAEKSQTNPGKAKAPSKPAASAAQAPAPQRIDASQPRLGWRALAMRVWLAIGALILAYVLLGMISLRLLRRRAYPITEGAWLSLVDELRRQLGIRGAVELLASGGRTMPMTWGLRRARLLLPADARGWSPELARAVLLHELAHVKRRDCLTQLLTQLACALFWFNPLVWLARARMQSEREQACDDLVLASGAIASSYAEQLLHVATGMSLPRLSAAAIAMARPSKLKDRLTAILDSTQNRQLAGRTALWFWLVAGACTAALGAVHVEDTLGDPALADVGRWAAARGWEVREVTPTDLESDWIPVWRNLPFHLSQAEEAAARESIELAKKTRSTHNGKTLFADPANRDALEELLKQQPDYFYAEFLLSMWHRDYGDPQEARRLIAAAYEHAPVVLVQRFEFADGRPVVGAAIYAMEIECNRVENNSLDHINLEFQNLRTDADGCVYLPVYDTVFRRYSVSGPYGYSVDFPSLGWFETSRKVGLLPVAIATTEAGSFVPSVPVTAPTVSTAEMTDGNSAELVAISRDDRDGSGGWWLPDGSPSPRQYETTNPSPDGWQTGPKWQFVVRFAKPLPDDAYKVFQASAPSGNARFGTVRGEDPRTTVAVFTSFSTNPHSISLRLGMASGQGTTLGFYDPKTHETTGELPEGFSFEKVEEVGGSGGVSYQCKVFLMTPKVDEQLRLFALDENQIEHSAGSWGEMTDSSMPKGMLQRDFEFWRLPLATISSFRLEAREYQWAEFDNIPLAPADQSGQPVTSGILPDGNSVELLAISTLEIEPVRQWLPDGSPSPRIFHSIDPKISPPPQKDKLRQFVLRFGGPPPADVHFEYEYSVATHSVQAFMGLAGEKGEILGAVFTEFVALPEMIDIRLGESFGDWQPLAEVDADTRVASGELPAGFRFTDIKHIGQRFEVTLDYPASSDRELRLIAIDPAGDEHPMPEQMFRHEPGTSRPTGSTFRVDFADPVDALRLEYRPIGWVRFDHIALSPRP